MFGGLSFHLFFVLDYHGMKLFSFHSRLNNFMNTSKDERVAL